MVKEDSTTSGMKGNFTYIGVDIDTTGKRLIDEIVNIAAYTPDAQFSQHIMPLMNLNPGARQRHQIRVINVGCFRMLKSMQTYKVIKTKTEIAALLDFLDWLEEVNKDKDGVIFVYHDQQKFTPYMIIEAMKKYRLMDRFEKLVKSFVNGYDLADEKQGNGIRYLTLCQNYKVQMEKLGTEGTEPNEFEGDATVRARLSYEIVMMMAHGGEKKNVEAEAMAAIVNDFIRAKALPVLGELDEISEQEECIKRQSSLRDIFRSYFQTSRYHRKRAVTFRRLLAEAKHDMESLMKIWAEGKRDAIAEHIKKLETLKEEEHEELIELLDCHFDPEKRPVKPIVQRRESVSNNNMNNNGNNGNGRGNGNNRNNNAGRRRRRSVRSRSMNKENLGRRSNSRRKSTSDKRNNNNNMMNVNNNNNVMDPKSGAVRKDHHQQVDANQNNVMVAAN